MQDIDIARQYRWRSRIFHTGFLALAAFLAVAGPTATSGTAAERRDRWEGDIHRFREHDWDRWRAGRWVHGRHGGRLGWWWVIGDIWYFYPAPVYPYPSPYAPPVVVAPSTPPPPPANYYYCDNPAGYYPYVPTCRVPWRIIPAG